MITDNLVEQVYDKHKMRLEYDRIVAMKNIQFLYIGNKFEVNTTSARRYGFKKIRKIKKKLNKIYQNFKNFCFQIFDIKL